MSVVSKVVGSLKVAHGLAAYAAVAFQHMLAGNCHHAAYSAGIDAANRRFPAEFRMTVTQLGGGSLVTVTLEGEVPRVLYFQNTVW